MVQYNLSPEQRPREIKRKKKRLLGRPEPDIIQIPKRSESSPVECSLRNTIIARTEENLLDRAIKNLAELRRNGWQFLPFSPPLSKSDRLTLETYVSQLKLRVEARKLHEQEIEREKSLWNVTEEVGEINPSCLWDYEKVNYMGY